MKTLMMNLNNINQLDKIDFISFFGNIFEESKFITEIAETKRPFKNKEKMISAFLMIFDDLDQENKINIIKKHPDLADKVKINKGLSKLSDDEQSRSGLKDCTEDEFNMFQKLNYSFKAKFNIPYILAVRNRNKNEIIEDFRNRLNSSDIQKEIEISINQVREIAKLRLNEIIDE